MNIENPAALHFMMQDELFFLKEDREKYISAIETSPVLNPPIEEEQVVTATETVVSGFNYMGKKGDLLILVHYPDSEHIQESHFAALENILKRKNLAISDAAILNMAKNINTDIENLGNYFDPKKILVLGKDALPGGIMPLDLNQPMQADRHNLLYTFSFDEMMDSPENKRTFWEQMKNF